VLTSLPEVEKLVEVDGHIGEKSGTDFAAVVV
jgi:hypothetical protein